jgi:hypothetical protein
VAAEERGPNLNLLDSIEPIRESPLYNSWRDPVPPEWFTINQRAYTLVDQDALYGSLLYSRAYGRTAGETLAEPTDAAVVAALGKIRFGGDTFFAIVESIDTTRTFTRTGTDSLTEPAEVTRGVRNQGVLVQPMVHDYP